MTSKIKLQCIHDDGQIEYMEILDVLANQTKLEILFASGFEEIITDQNK